MSKRKAVGRDAQAATLAMMCRAIDKIRLKELSYGDLWDGVPRHLHDDIDRKLGDIGDRLWRMRQILDDGHPIDDVTWG